MSSGRKRQHRARHIRPPSSSLSYSGPGNDDTRSPGSVGGTPGPLSAAPPLSQQSVDNVSEAVGDDRCQRVID
ncbi:hypothetical protein OUZ56_019202 [Daphnia magna]|uniref:Uncharacterized protein n=1 Tax=Daphnia magna TaxID=35525 RepID=A0ABQ9ZBQ2_9CRUS|nr:hypothetical protein OUZ56_019202 [Daphnia magna]